MDEEIIINAETMAMQHMYIGHAMDSWIYILEHGSEKDKRECRERMKRAAEQCKTMGRWEEAA